MSRLMKLMKLQQLHKYYGNTNQNTISDKMNLPHPDKKDVLTTKKQDVLTDKPNKKQQKASKTIKKMKTPDLQIKNSKPDIPKGGQSDIPEGKGVIKKGLQVIPEGEGVFKFTEEEKKQLKKLIKNSNKQQQAIAAPQPQPIAAPQPQPQGQPQGTPQPAAPKGRQRSNSLPQLSQPLLSPSLEKKLIAAMQGNQSVNLQTNELMELSKIFLQSDAKRRLSQPPTPAIIPPASPKGKPNTDSDNKHGKTTTEAELVGEFSSALLTKDWEGVKLKLDAILKSGFGVDVLADKLTQKNIKKITKKLKESNIYLPAYKKSKTDTLLRWKSEVTKAKSLNNLVNEATASASDTDEEQPQPQPQPTA
jgi:hypothetical protein